MTRRLARLAARYLSWMAKRRLQARQRIEAMKRDEMTALLRDHVKRSGKLGRA